MIMPLRVLVFGGRDYQDRDVVFSALDNLHAKYGVAAVIHGDAPGADALGKDWAESREIQTATFPAEWGKHGRAAGPIRNQRMIDEGMIDAAIGLPGGAGTADMRARIIKAGIALSCYSEALRKWGPLA